MMEELFEKNCGENKNSVKLNKIWVTGLVQFLLMLSTSSSASVKSGIDLYVPKINGEIYCLNICNVAFTISL